MLSLSSGLENRLTGKEGKASGSAAQCGFTLAAFCLAVGSAVKSAVQGQFNAPCQCGNVARYKSTVPVYSAAAVARQPVNVVRELRV